MRFVCLIFLSLISCSQLSTQGRRDELLLIMRKASRREIIDETRWELKNQKIIFHGTVTSGDCEQFKLKVTPNVRTFEVNSLGGDVSESLCIAEEMLIKKFEETIVNGVCISSCANYFFTANPRKIILTGLVGFHGNAQALLETEPNLEEYLLGVGIPKESIKDTAQKLYSVAKKESAFFSELGIEQKLFNLTQLPDKGAMDGNEYYILIPGQKTLDHYGIRNVQGESDLSFAEDIRSFFGITFLYR